VISLGPVGTEECSPERQDSGPAHDETTPQCTVRETSAEIETIYRSYQVLL